MSHDLDAGLYADDFAYRVWFIDPADILEPALPDAAQIIADYTISVIRPPFVMEQILPDGDTLYIPGCPGDLREARRRRDREAADRGVHVSRISLTDSTGKAVA